MYLKCTLFFPLGWKFCVSNVLWNWPLRLETRPELQFKRSKITPRKRHLFVPRSGSLQFFPFIFTSVTNSLSQTNLLVSWNQYVYTLHNAILRIARNFLESRENIKISTHPFYHINLGWFSWEWRRKEKKFE